jgi:hypothetical protein
MVSSRELSSELPQGIGLYLEKVSGRGRRRVRRFSPIALSQILGPDDRRRALQYAQDLARWEVEESYGCAFFQARCRVPVGGPGEGYRDEVIWVNILPTRRVDKNGTMVI